MFKLVSKYKPNGDQPQAINELVKGLEEGKKEQVLHIADHVDKNFSFCKLNYLKFHYWIS